MIIPPRSPRAIACPEWFVFTARTEVTDRMLIFGDRHLRSILAEFKAHYNGRRSHRSRQVLPPRPDHPIAGPSRERIKPWSKTVAEFWRPTGLAIDAATGVLVAIAHRLPARVHPAPALASPGSARLRDAAWAPRCCPVPCAATVDLECHRPNGGTDDGCHAVVTAVNPGPAFLPEERGDAARPAAGSAAKCVHGQHGRRRRPRMAILGRYPRLAAADVLPAPHPPLPGLAPCLPVLLRALAQGV